MRNEKVLWKYYKKEVMEEKKIKRKEEDEIIELMLLKMKEKGIKV